MRKTIISVLAGLAVIGAAYAGGCALAAFGSPSIAVSKITIRPECRSLPPESWTVHHGTSMECEQLRREDARLKAHPGLAIREGRNLTIFYRGLPVTRLQMLQWGDKPSPCNGYDIRSVLALYDRETAKTENVADVVCHVGEVSRHVLVLPDGTPWWLSRPAASSDGRRIGGMPDGPAVPLGLTIYDWPRRNVVAYFPVYCDALAWKDADHLTASSCRGKRRGKYAFNARVWRDERGRWQLQATQWLDANRVIKIENGYIMNTPVFSLRPLPHFDSAV